MKTKESQANLLDYARPTLFYDGACSLCRREIAHYRRLDRKCNLRWVDISRDRDVLEAHGLKRETAMQRFHVLDARGRWQTGAWGFVELWGHLTRYRWLARLIRYTGTSALLDRLYARFARWRLRRRCTTECLPPQETGP